MKNPRTKKLHLSRATVRALDRDTLERAAGATIFSKDCPSIRCRPTQMCPATWNCQTFEGCPQPTLLSCVGCPSMYLC